ncbi:hypothetical protein J5N97_024836 [Dioscorea zingiberensis]|uniref:Transposase (putative) gypsy type domain-containing protein n=1 Tax=Dioscorea zingiberensis TaxID=325984 RepID=A0A9D5C861_9LILI|nr:hypothetical protein J5N97_024836 [Dioscorea zingiberensis]
MSPRFLLRPTLRFLLRSRRFRVDFGDVPVQGSRVHPASRAMGRGSDTFISLLGQKEVDSLVARYEINLSLFEVRVPCSGERASSPREGEIAIYQDALLGGLRLPFSDFAKAILEEYHLCPSQLAPNSWRLLNGFVIVFKHYGISPTVRWFRMLFSLCLESNADWYYFSARSGRKFLGKVPSSIKRWKSKFFFVKSKSEWDVRTKWEVPRTDITCEEMTGEEEVLLKSMTWLSKVYMDEFLTKENLVKCRLIVSAENPMEDEDLSYVKGLLASFEGEVHPPLPRGRKKKEVVLGQGADTSKEERKKRKRKETDSSKKGAGSLRERRTKRKYTEDVSGPEIAEEQVGVPKEEVRVEEVRPALSPISEGPSSSRPEDILLIEVEAGEAALLDKLKVADSVLKGSATKQKELSSEDTPFRDAGSVKGVLMAMRPEQFSTKLQFGREEATYQLFRSAMLTAHWADRVGNLCQEDLAKMEMNRASLSVKL